MRKTAILSLTALSVTFLASLAARADVTIVSNVSVAGMPTGARASLHVSSDSKVVSTAYYKGTHQRTESSGSVTLTDTSDGKIYTLDPAAKTYYVRDVKAAMSGMAANPMLAMLKLQPKVFLNPGGHSKVIAGKPASDYKWTLIMKFAAAEGAPAGMEAMLPTITIKGEQWMTTALALPGGVNGGAAIGQHMTENMTMAGMPPLFANGMKTVSEKMATMKGTPLSSVVSFWVQFPETSPLASMAGVPKEPIVTTNEVTSVSEEPLSDDLFVVPADYKKIDPPSLGIPGLGGGDDGSGGAPAPGATAPATTPPPPPAGTPKP